MHLSRTAVLVVAGLFAWLPQHAIGQSLPGAPGTPSASVSGTSVTITWSAPSTGAPLSYIILAGTTSGSSNLGTFNVGPSTSVTAAVANGTYFIRVAAVNAAGQGAPSAEISFTVGTPGSAPGVPGTPAASVSGTTVTISWSAPGSGGAPSYYLIAAGTTPGGTQLGTFNVGPGTSISSPLSPGTYYVRIIAVNAFGQSAPSAEATFTIGGGGGAPGAPGTPTASVSGTSVTLSWNAPTIGGAATYYLLVAGTTPGGSELGTHNVGATTTLTTTLGAGTYYIRAIAANSSGQSAPSGEVSFTIRGGGGSVDGTWQGVTSQGVPIYFIVSSGAITTLNVGGTFTFSGGTCTMSTQVAVNVPITGGQFSHTRGASAGTTSWTIQGTFSSSDAASGSATVTATASSTSSCSGTVNVTWSASNYGVGAPILPYAPFGFSASASGGTVNFTWSAPFASDPPITQYVLEVGTSSGASNAGTFTFSAPATSYSLSSLTPGTYYARLKGRNSSGTGAASREVNFTILAVPGAPSNLAVSLSGATANFTWTAPTTGSTPTSYDVEIGPTSGSSSTGVFNTTGTSYSRALSGGTYYARVKAKNANGSSAASNEVTFTITLNPTGTWQGLTAQNTAVGFIISGGNITTLVAGGTFGGCTATTRLNLLSYSVASGINASGSSGDLTYNVTGTFASNTSASGSISLTRLTPGCSGSFSSTWTATNLGDGAGFWPDRPSNLAASLTGSTVNFTWIAPSSAVLGTASDYVLEIGTTTGGTETGTYTTTSTSYSVSSLPIGNYYARVKARNSSGTSAASSQITFSVVAPTGAPSSFAVEMLDDFANMRFSWVAPASGGTPTSYVVEVGSTSGAVDSSYETTGAPLLYERNFTSPGPFYARVRAKNAAGTGSASNEIQFAALRPPFTPYVSASSGMSRTFAWSQGLFYSSATATITYDLEVTNSTGAALVYPGGSTTSMTVAFSAPGTYTVRVRAKIGSLTGRWSSSYSVTIS